MRIKIDSGVLLIEIDRNAERIEKIVSSKPSGKTTQGAIYVNKQYIGRNCLFILTEPRFEGDKKNMFWNIYNNEKPGEKIYYFDLIIREIKSVKTSKEYETGRAYLPPEWIGKKIIGIILSQ